MNLVRRRPSAPPEDSIAMRVVVALSVEVGVWAVVSHAPVGPATATAALVLAPFGYWVSYRRRYRSSLILKVALVVGLIVSTDLFLHGMRTVQTVDEARVPLATLFLWVQVLHAFDVPRRRDLAFSMVSSTTLMAAAAVLSLTTGFVGILALWAVLAGAWLWLSARPRPDQVTTPISVRRSATARTPTLAAVRSAGVAGLAAVVLASGVFLAMPRLPAVLGHRPPTPTSADVTNPGLPGAGSDGIVDFGTLGYPGFSSAMDLRARGRLSDQVVFRVRADQPSLWRAEAFDTYDGSVWTPSDARLASVSLDMDTGSFEVDGFGFAPTPVPPSLSDQLVQTFYIAQPQPNVLFAAARPQTIYFPSGGLRVDVDGSVRSPILLDEGMVYSVISQVPRIPQEVLATVPLPPATRHLERYLQLPAELPRRDRDLAARIVAGASGEEAAVLSVQSWLRRNTRYDLTVPREPPGVDAVDHFLFETRRGFCEHIASAMAVLLRAVGVPTRIVTGYGPGERNPLTGYWEVRQSDAHAWVEVYYPNAGWLPYDPTFGVPEATSVFGGLIGQEVVAAIERLVSHSVPQPLRQAVGVVVRAIGGAARVLRELWVVLAVTLAAGLVLTIGWRRRRRGRAARPPDDAGRAFEALVAALAAVGHARTPSQTPSELLDAVRADVWFRGEAEQQSAVVVRTFELARFAPPAARPDHEEGSRALAAAARVAELARDR